MGGESVIRGFDIRSITPVTFIPVRTQQQITYNCNTCLNGFGQPTPRTIGIPVLGYTITFPGGDTQGWGNAEYRIPIIANTFQTVLFFDGGNNGIVRKSAFHPDTTRFHNITYPSVSPSFPHSVPTL